MNNQNRVDSYWLVGDIAYADDAFAHVGDLLKFDYEDIYDGFVAWNQNISASKPLMVSAGNHGTLLNSLMLAFNHSIIFQHHITHVTHFTL